MVFMSVPSRSNIISFFILYLLYLLQRYKIKKPLAKILYRKRFLFYFVNIALDNEVCYFVMRNQSISAHPESLIVIAGRVQNMSVQHCIIFDNNVLARLSTLAPVFIFSRFETYCIISGIKNIVDD